MKAHLFRCNARPKENPTNYSLDINLTLPAPEKQPTGFEVLESSTTGKSEVLAELTQEQLLALIKKIQDLHAKHVPEIRTIILDHPALDERKYVFVSFSRSWRVNWRNCDLLRHGKKIYRSRSSETYNDNTYSRSQQPNRKIVKNIKHAHQQASLLGNMQRLNMLDDPSTCYVEFGAGRGELSNYLKIAVDDHGTATFVLVDRTPPRNKFDSALLGLEEIKSLVKRHTMDIKDLVLADVPELRRDVTATQREPPVKAGKDTQDGEETKDGEGETATSKEAEYVEKKPVVAISKHLCGGATDITLKCLINYQKS